MLENNTDLVRFLRAQFLEDSKRVVGHGKHYSCRWPGESHCQSHNRFLEACARQDFSRLILKLVQEPEPVLRAEPSPKHRPRLPEETLRGLEK